MMWEKNPTLGAMVGDRVPTTYTNFVEWVRQAHSFDGMAGFEDVSLNRTGTGEPERIAGARVTPNFFGVLGVTPEAGSSFDYVERDPSHNHAAMLSNGYWKSHFGGNPGVIGQTLTLNDVPYIVVGVLPANFHLPSTREGSEQRKPDIWIPYEPPAQRNQAELDRLKMQVFARLRPGVSLEQARQEMDVIGKRLEEQNPTLNAGFGIERVSGLRGRCGQRTEAQLDGAAVGGRTDPAAGVREPCQPDADARHGAAEGARHSQGAGSEPRPPDCADDRGRTAAQLLRMPAGHCGRALRNPVAAGVEAGRPATSRANSPERQRAAVHHGDRHRRRSCVRRHTGDLRFQHRRQHGAEGFRLQRSGIPAGCGPCWSLAR